MASSLIVDHKESGVEIALLKDQKLVEFHKENTEINYHVGDVYLGRIRKFSPGINAAFVDIGYGKDAFLHYHDLGPQVLTYIKYVNGVIDGSITSPDIGKFSREKSTDKNGKIDVVLKKEVRLLVQVSKEPISTKGARITAEITFAGRYLVLVPFSNRISVSSRVRNKEEKDRLVRLMKSIKPKNFGVIVRTVAQEVKAADLDADLKSLVEKWNTCFNSIKNFTYGQKVVGEMDKVSAYLRDMLTPSFNQIVVNDKSIKEELTDYLGKIAKGKEKIVKYYDGQMPIFDKYKVESQVKQSFGKTVMMKSGAYLVIEHTEALHVIDVNSGATSRKKEDGESNALRVNLESAEEVARQLRLRDMGGIIVVDFIDMRQDKNRKQLYGKMKELLKKEKVKHSVLPLSRFGLMQITRERVRPVMNIDTTEVCPSCNGKGKVETSSIVATDHIFNSLRELVTKKPSENITIVVHPFLESYLNKGFPSMAFKWRLKLKKSFNVKSADSNELLEYYFVNKKGEALE